MLDAFLRIQMVENGVGVALVTCCEDDNIAVLAHVFDYLFRVRPHANISADYFALD